MKTVVRWSFWCSCFWKSRGKLICVWEPHLPCLRRHLCAGVCSEEWDACECLNSCRTLIRFIYIIIAKLSVVWEYIGPDLSPAQGQRGHSSPDRVLLGLLQREPLHASSHMKMWINRISSLAWLLEAPASKNEALNLKIWSLLTGTGQNRALWSLENKLTRRNKGNFFHQWLIWGGLVWAQILGERIFRSESQPQ